MKERDLARKLLNQLRRVLSPTPVKLLAEFRRLVVAEHAKTKAKR
jgi:hypothetical protein